MFMLGNSSGHDFNIEQWHVRSYKLAVGLLISMKFPMTLKSEKDHYFLPWTSLY